MRLVIERVYAVSPIVSPTLPDGLAATTCPNTLCRVRLRKEPGFRLIAMKDVRRLTGLEPAEVLRRLGAQELTRIGESGVREELVRVPSSFCSKSRRVEGSSRTQ
jgi:hypothetical protein